MRSPSSCGVGLLLGAAVLDARHVVDAHGVAVRLADDDAAERLERLDAPCDAQGEVCGPVSTLPPGVVRFCAAIARCTSAAVRPCARSASGSSQTLIWRFCPPMRLTWPTPLMLSICRRTCLSAISRGLADRLVRAHRDEQDGRRAEVDLAHDRRIDALRQVAAGWC